MLVGVGRARRRGLRRIARRSGCEREIGIRSWICLRGLLSRTTEILLMSGVCGLRRVLVRVDRRSWCAADRAVSSIGEEADRLEGIELRNTI